MQFNWTVTMGPEEWCIPYVDDAFASGRKVGLGREQQAIWRTRLMCTEIFILYWISV
jgi:hypothetical protein